MLVALKQIIQRFNSDDEGAALVEMAIVTPFVLLLSAGVFEFGNILNTRMLLDAGVKDAARYMARCSSDWDTCKPLAQKLAANGAIDGTVARVNGWLPEQVEITKTSTQAIDTATGTELYLSSTANVIVAQVSTSYPYPDLGLWSYLGFSGQLALTVSHQERVFGW
ncbi:pilus assembly protein [Mesorhizobium sp. B2-9-1]|uniref:TadE/TadG family type IV pilus assembly protein n=1 Tax=unclassified Mesorhizobium TaxID=325217 RepID=UPI001129DE26|nr:MULTISPECIES: TadE/TadG family type IV pilus assembly protein [unclassified Mesorhizobium]TPI41491.1 pilus assembly protein [Mesorhizobium sp. B2-9-1]TPJ15490.1 pilus assembly protein [Mesorhizobium sp. B2-7-2]